MRGAMQAWLQTLTLVSLLDWGMVILLAGLALYFTRRTRAVWLVRAYIILLVLAAITRPFQVLHQALSPLLIGAAVVLADLFRPQLRRIFESLGRVGDPEVPREQGERDLNQPGQPGEPLEEIISAVRKLASERWGALIILEIAQPIDPRIFINTGTPIHGRVSDELLLTIFYPSTPMHDGAVIIDGTQIKAAQVILPVSERPASRQLGTRHRAAMGITEQAPCLGIVVSEETGSISLAENGSLQRPLNPDTLRELLKQRLAQGNETRRANLGEQGRQWPQSWKSISAWPPRRLLSVLRDALSKE